MTKVKICGLRRPEDIAYANELEPDYIGFVFVKGRKRYVEPETAAALRKNLKAPIQAVGVFIDEPIESLVEIAQKVGLDFVQLHGSEDEDYLVNARAALDAQVQIIQAIQVHGEEDLARAEASSADYILLDSGTGSGKTFDWTHLQGMKREYFLAGGISAENVGEAIETLHPYAVDLSSSVETDGVKDIEKMRALMKCVRG